MEFQTETASFEHGTSSRNETAYLVCKRAFDIAASFCALVVLSPVFLIICLIIYLDCLLYTSYWGSALSI